MTAGVAVLDATPLIAFHQIGQLGLVRDLFRQSLVPATVAQEVAPSLGLLPQWLQVRDVIAMPAFSRTLDAGEREVIALALRVSASFVVLDDLAGRLIAAELGLSVIGSLGLLVRAKRNGLIREVRPMMADMIANGLFTSEELQRVILELAGESSA